MGAAAQRTTHDVEEEAQFSVVPGVSSHTRLNYLQALECDELYTHTFRPGLGICRREERRCAIFSTVYLR